MSADRDKKTMTKNLPASPPAVAPKSNNTSKTNSPRPDTKPKGGSGRSIPLRESVPAGGGNITE